MPISDCPNCGDNRYAYDDREHAIPQLRPEDDPGTDSAHAIPVWTVVCMTCGFMRLFSGQYTTLDFLMERDTSE